MSKMKKATKGSTPLKVSIAAVCLLVSIGFSVLISNSNKTTSQENSTGTPGIKDKVSASDLGTDSKPLYKVEDTSAATEHVTSETEQNVSANSLYGSLIADLTNKAQEYCAEHRASLSKMQFIGVSNVKVEGTEVAVKGEFKNGEQFGNCIFTMQNENPDLEIFNISGTEIDTEDFVKAVREILNDSATSFALDARQRLINFDEINKSAVVQKVVEGLSAEEAANLTENVDSASFSLLLNSREKNEDGFKYTYTVVIYTENHVYASTFSFNSANALSSTDLKNRIKDHVMASDTVCENSAAKATDDFEKLLHDLKSQKTTKSNVEESEQALSRY